MNTETKTELPNKRCACGLCGATYTAKDIPDASRWLTDHGCNFGKPELHRVSRSLTVAGSPAIWANRLAKTIGERDKYKAHAEKLAEQLSLIVRTVNDTLRHGLTAGQIEALEDCVKSSNVSLNDYRK